MGQYHCDVGHYGGPRPRDLQGGDGCYMHTWLHPTSAATESAGQPPTVSSTTYAYTRAPDADETTPLQQNFKGVWAWALPSFEHHP